jgi:hypothetical protein
MGNLTFNVANSIIITMGLVSLTLSFEPNWVTMIQKVSRYFTSINVPVADQTE